MPDDDFFRVESVSMQGADGVAARPTDVDMRKLSSTLHARLLRATHALWARFPASRRACIHHVVAPGRVNLIGEHIDYEGYAVLPMAIEQSVCVSFALAAPLGGVELHLVNVDSVFPSAILKVSQDQQRELQHDHAALFAALTAPSVASHDTGAAAVRGPAEWTRYVACGYLAAIAIHPRFATASCRLQLRVDGTIPPACGLSSSSALVVASALAIATALCNSLQLPIPKRRRIAECCRVAEQFIGTAGGGMDQAVCCLAKRGKALFVSFAPLHVTPVALPLAFQRGEFVFVVVNSMVKAHKAVDAAVRFNRRVVECALATKLIAKKLHLLQWHTMTQLVEVQSALTVQVGRDVSVEELVDAALAHCGDQDTYSLEELQTAFDGRSALDLFQGSRLEGAARGVLLHAGARFRLAARARHVWLESDRVRRFRDVCEDASLECDNDRAARLGQLMIESHESCRDLYECSCAELDELVSLAMSQGGAVGARLTGAGWGGCIVVLVAANRVDQLRACLTVNFFMRRGVSDRDAEAMMFVSSPSSGVSLFTCE